MASIQADPGKSVRIATACTECQRRKQKCSREWPCNHCQARRIAHLCKFVPKKVLARSGGDAPAAAAAAATAGNDTRPVESRVGSGSNGNAVHVPQSSQAGSSISVFPGNDDIRVIGYLPDEQEPALGNTSSESSAAITLTPHDTVLPEMENALRAIPPKPYTDLLVQHFLGDTNFHYYALYPPSFSHDYSVWWSNRTKTNILTPEFTCLLLRVCACAALYLDVKIQAKLESDLGESVQTLTEHYHHAAQRLSSTISPGKGGLSQVQQLFLTSFWYKTEGLFIESWHSLSSAIHQGQELGLYKRSFKVEMSEFEKEMRRRVWCLLYSWDWQMSLMLARPSIINTNYYGFELPNLRLESPDMPEGLPSPIAHVALQCQLGQDMSKIPGVMGGSLLPEQAGPIQHKLAKWMAGFPPVFQLKDPDTQYDADYHYVVFQRYQLNSIGHMLSFVPVKLSLTKPVDSTTTEADMAMRKTAIDCSFQLLDVSRQMLACLLPYNAKFYLGVFLVFDTAAYLCSAVTHDHTHTLYQRERVIDAIVSALGLLENVRNTKLGATCHAIIRKILFSLPSDVRETIFQCSSFSPESSAGGPKTPSDGQHHDLHDPTVSSDNPALNLNALSTMADDISGLSVPTTLGPPLSGTMASDLAGADDLANVDLGGLSQIWDWEYLGLGP